MNRAERRRQLREGRNAKPDRTYHMKDQDLQDMRSDAVMDAFVIMLGCSVKVLWQQYGWRNRKRLPEFAEAVLDEYKNFENGRMTVKEFQDFIFDHCGIKFMIKEED